MAHYSTHLHIQHFSVLCAWWVLFLVTTPTRMPTSPSTRCMPIRPCILLRAVAYASLRFGCGRRSPGAAAYRAFPDVVFCQHLSLQHYCGALTGFLIRYLLRSYLRIPIPACLPFLHASCLYLPACALLRLPSPVLPVCCMVRVRRRHILRLRITLLIPYWRCPLRVLQRRHHAPVARQDGRMGWAGKAARY